MAIVKHTTLALVFLGMFLQGTSFACDSASQAAATSAQSQPAQVEIRRYVTGEILATGKTAKEAVQEAVTKGASMSGADLTLKDLSGSMSAFLEFWRTLTRFNA